MNFYGKIKKFLGVKKKNIDYLYLIALPVSSFEINEEKQKRALRDAEILRTSSINFIKNHLGRSHRKEIVYSDVLVAPQQMLSYMLFGSASPHTNYFLRPLLFEIYAYKEKGDVKFSYPVETLLFKIHNEEIKILKFTIEY